MTPVRLSDEDVERIAQRVVEKLYESKLVRAPKSPANDNMQSVVHTTGSVSKERSTELLARVRAKRARKGVVY